MREAFRQGGEAAYVDGRLAVTSRPWGFALGDVRVPVHLWYGEADRLVARSMAERLAREVPDCTARFVPETGHLVLERPEVVEQMRAVLGLSGAGG